MSIFNALPAHFLIPVAAAGSAAVLGAVAMAGLVATQTGSPATNPASKPIISYGSPS